jgi:hypothetical protein
MAISKLLLHCTRCLGAMPANELAQYLDIIKNRCFTYDKGNRFK